MDLSNFKFFKLKAKLFILFFLIFFLSFFSNIFSQTLNNNLQQEQNLEKLIQQKNEELKKIEAEKQALQKKLESIYASKDSLSKEIQSITYQISQLNLKIKANKVAIEQLSLEIESSQEEVKDINEQIKATKETISKLIVELQEKENDSLLFTVLSSDTLSQSLNKAYTIYLLNKNLSENVKKLEDLKTSLETKINFISQNKIKREREEQNLLNNQNLLALQKETKDYILTQTKNQEKIYEEQMKKLEEQQLAISKVIEEIETKLRKSFNTKLLPQEEHTFFAFPVDPIGEKVIVTQRYGYTKFAERAYRTNFHTGVDFGAPLGSPVYAAADGVVMRVDNNDKGLSKWKKYQYGKYILIKHNNNLTTLYAHLSQQLVKAGDQVKKGDLIGYSGNTGYTFGPHLHFGVYYTPELILKSIPPANGLVPLGITINPLNYLPSDFILKE